MTIYVLQTGINCPTVFPNNINALNDTTKSILRSLIQPRTILLLAAAVNYIFFFSMSGIVDEFFTNRIPICELCGWYWDWSFTNPPSLILYSSICLFILGRIGEVFACVISGYACIEGVLLLSGGTGLIDNVSEHIRIVLAYDHLHFYDSLDIQYLFALIAFVIAVSYLSIEIIKQRKDI